MRRREPSELAARLGLPGEPDDRFLESLTHGSINERGGHAPSNVRLAWLGDAVLEVVCRHREWETGAQSPLGTIDLRVNEATRNSRLADFARDAQLDLYVDMGEGADDVRGKLGPLSTALEAVIGAIFLTHGLEKARECALMLIEGRVPAIQGPLA